MGQAPDFDKRWPVHFRGVPLASVVEAQHIDRTELVQKNDKSQAESVAKSSAGPQVVQDQIARLAGRMLRAISRVSFRRSNTTYFETVSADPSIPTVS